MSASIPIAAVGVRMEFLSQCLRQLVHSRQPTGAVYVLAMRWCNNSTYNDFYISNNNNNSKNTQTKMTLDDVRLQHLRILLKLGGGNRDEEAEQMVPQVCLLQNIFTEL